MALKAGEGGSKRQQREGGQAVTHGDGWKPPASAGPDALLWLELTDGVTREALVERLAQARMSTTPVEASRDRWLPQETFEEL